LIRGRAAVSAIEDAVTDAAPGGGPHPPLVSCA
jgi:hypothetical protein